MDRQFTPSDLPTNWRARYGAALVEAITSRTPAFRHKARRCQQRVMGRQPKVTLDTATLSCDSLNIFQALYLFDTAAFCYVWRGFDPGCRLDSDIWRVEAFDAWSALCTQEAKDDGRKGLAFIGLTDGLATRLQRWVDPGRDTDAEETAPAAANGADIDELVCHHRRMCDLVDARAGGPGEELVSLTLQVENDDKYRAAYHNPTFMPSCRAVLVIAPIMLSARRQVLLVLTGDDGDLKSGPPSFADIPTGEIISMRSNNVAEVSLQTALWFIGCVEAAENEANEALRATHARRRSDIAAAWRAHAVEDLDHLAKLEKEAPEKPTRDRELERVLRAVIGNELGEPLSYAA